MLHRFAAAASIAGLAACAAAGAQPGNDSTHRPTASVTAIVNCGYPESVARLGLTWATHYQENDPNGRFALSRAHVEIANRSRLPHRLIIDGVVECSIDHKCEEEGWTAVDRTLAPGERWSLDVDARMSYVERGDAEVVVVSLKGTIDGEKACVDVGAWLARSSADEPP
jgi:hypothetical protein